MTTNIKKHLGKIELKKNITTKLNNLSFYGVHGNTINKYKERFTNALPGKQFQKLTSLMNELNVINKDINKKKDIEEAYEKWKEEQIKEFNKPVVKEDIYNVIDTFKTSIIKGNNGDIIDLTPIFQDISSMKNIIKNYKGKTITIKYIVNGNIIYQNDYEVPNDNYKDWFDNIIWDWTSSGTSGDDKTFFKENKHFGNLHILHMIEVEKKYSEQYYLDGITHCVFTPMKKWFEEKLFEVTTKASKDRYKTLIKKISKLETEYYEGVPDNNDVITNICDQLNVDITIETPFQQNIFECKSTKKALTSFKFLNTRLNHVDMQEHNKIVITNKDIEKTQEELNEIKKTVDEKKVFHTFTRINNEISAINTVNYRFVRKSEFQEAKNLFLEETGLINCMIDDVDDKLLSSFVNESTHFNGSVDFVDNKPNIKDLVHHDQEKAYTASKTSKYYEGFLGKITDFRKTNKYQGVGIYMIDNINFTNASQRIIDVNNRLRIYENLNQYPSCELKMLIDEGVKFDYVIGCWGAKSIDFEFNNDMITKKDNGIPYYAKFVGSISSHNTRQKIWMKGNKEFFETINFYSSGLNARYNEQTNEGYFYCDKKHNYHLSHITSFITAYQRLGMIEQLFEMNLNKVVKIVTDGIYCYDHKFDIKNVFRLKEETDQHKLDNVGAIQYASGIKRGFYANLCYDIFIKDVGDERDNYAVSYYKGCGGSGKTSCNLSDKGLIKINYFVTSWKLSTEKKNEYGVKNNVIANLISKDETVWKKILRYNNVLIVDECSMISNTVKKLIINRYDGMKIIFCGDNHQLEYFCEDGEEKILFNEDDIDYVKEFNYSYRIKCEKLRFINNKLIEFIDKKVDALDGLQYVYNFFQDAGQIIDKNELVDKYNIEDYILTHTHICKNNYTDMFKGMLGKEKYYATKAMHGYYNGDIIIADKPPYKSDTLEIRHAFTIASVQGITVKDNLFIDINLKDLKLIYTAISRAEYFDKVYFVV